MDGKGKEVEETQGMGSGEVSLVEQCFIQRIPQWHVGLWFDWNESSRLHSVLSMAVVNLLALFGWCEFSWADSFVNGWL